MQLLSKLFYNTTRINVVRTGIWITLDSHYCIHELATSYAIHRKVPVSNMVSYFNGVFYVFFFTSYDIVSGNAISSIVYFAFKTDRDVNFNITNVCVERDLLMKQVWKNMF